MNVVLNEAEYEVLLRQDPTTRDNGGYQRFLVSLQERTNEQTMELELTDEDLEKIPRYAFDYGQGGWEDRLIHIFGRHLGASLGR